MREVAQTVREAGLAPWSAAGTAERQAWMTTLADAGTFGSRGDAGFARSADWRIEADRILSLIRDSNIEPAVRESTRQALEVVSRAAHAATISR